jgi:hypothetical protein
MTMFCAFMIEELAIFALMVFGHLPVSFVPEIASTPVVAI